ncbi:uncharacterized protein LOC112344907 [Selaginella moellendorffii]|uniref:uncharacterized protein LOC112344907 n=1 Tax=Selaginella moellendorffii TaxID=88036 RepID=UPI000D1CAC4D|nr:uncharacterized protein LOC112344907 [Selaginella moellendorffii]|eukprot:XP_024526242.1 uncharacterized protein LOC112344907 [Selaginella moellendorffii]
MALAGRFHILFAAPERRERECKLHLWGFHGWHARFCQAIENQVDGGNDISFDSSVPAIQLPSVTVTTGRSSTVCCAWHSEDSSKRVLGISLALFTHSTSCSSGWSGDIWPKFFIASPLCLNWRWMFLTVDVLLVHSTITNCRCSWNVTL